MIGIYITGPVELTTGGLDPPDANRRDGWLEDYQPGALSGRGRLRLSRDPSRALRFRDSQDAIDFAYQVPWNRRTGPDGIPNKPLMRVGYENRDIPGA